MAAKVGPAHLTFWLLAIVLFYLPSAAVVLYLNRWAPVTGITQVNVQLPESLGTTANAVGIGVNSAGATLYVTQ